MRCDLRLKILLKSRTTRVQNNLRTDRLQYLLLLLLPYNRNDLDSIRRRKPNQLPPKRTGSSIRNDRVHP